MPTAPGKRRLAAAAAVLFFSAAPFYVWRETVSDAATDFRVELDYLVSGWTAWALIAAGALWFARVALSVGRSEYSRWYLRPGLRRAYEAWGASLYVLGVLLAVQTAQVARVV